ncbi:MAG: hypothetical protein NVSMB52_02590 [Chloroflexota bacterium]
MFAPFLVASTLLLLATGIVLLVTPPANSDAWVQIHSVAFFFWFFLTSVHVLTYLLRALRLTRSDIAGDPRRHVAGVPDRWTLVAGSILLGTALAIAFLPWDAAWANWLGALRDGG